MRIKARENGRAKKEKGKKERKWNSEDPNLTGIDPNKGEGHNGKKGKKEENKEASKPMVQFASVLKGAAQKYREQIEELKEDKNQEEEEENEKLEEGSNKDRKIEKEDKVE